jgi:hypothetical protein
MATERIIEFENEDSLDNYGSVKKRSLDETDSEYLVSEEEVSSTTTVKKPVQEKVEPVNPVTAKITRMKTMNTADIDLPYELISLMENQAKNDERLNLCEDQIRFSNREMKAHTDWFTFQNRIQRLIEDLLRPTIERFDSIKKNVEKTMDNVQGLEQ